MNITDVGRLYFTRVKYDTVCRVPGCYRLRCRTKDLPLVERGRTIETEHPYREGRALVLRPPLAGTGFAIGWWRRARLSESQALLQAIGYDGHLSYQKAPDEIHEAQGDDFYQEDLLY